MGSNPTSSATSPARPFWQLKAPVLGVLASKSADIGWVYSKSAEHRSFEQPESACQAARRVLLSGDGARVSSLFRLLCEVVVGPCATKAHEPSQGRKAAALSGRFSVPQTVWPLPHDAGGFAFLGV